MKVRSRAPWRLFVPVRGAAKPRAAFSAVARGNVSLMDTQAAAELKSTLQGVTLPAEKPVLLEYAVQQRTEPALLSALLSLPEREYESLDDVVEELLYMQ